MIIELTTEEAARARMILEKHISSLKDMKLRMTPESDSYAHFNDRLTEALELKQKLEAAQ